MQKWPEYVKEIKYISSADSSMQPALFYAPSPKSAVPLVVVLHTWSSDYTQDYGIPYAKWCAENSWCFIHPNFRGPNNKKEATGSELAIRDVINAVEYAKKNANIDVNRIYLVGYSGGGYTSLLVAGRFPEIWAGVSVWVPILDIKSWYYECKQKNLSYANDIKNSCGGIPGESLAIDFEYRSRSPATFLANAANLQLDINAGISDETIPISHSLKAFNLVALKKDRIPEENINYFVENKCIPPHIKKFIGEDSLYKEKGVLFRKISGCSRITVFNGGHDMIPQATLVWLNQQKK
ncbi:MAG: prolyl oligopeptidase family serine peptidase [Phycisphaerae bacterium]|jgi:dipeptidyl aminopeptidase/acylaminoacyl peptidase